MSKNRNKSDSVPAINPGPSVQDRQRVEDTIVVAGSAIAGLELDRIPTADLRDELARGLTLTADTLSRLGLIWQELERRGEDLSSLRTGLARTLPLIAAGLLAAEAVVAFAGRPAVLRALEGVPLEQQRRLAAGEALEAIDPTNPTNVITEPIVRLPTAAVRLAIADGTVRTPDLQRLAFRPRKRRREESGYHYQPHYNSAAGTITVGRMTVALGDLLQAVSATAGPDNSLLHASPDEYVHVKVRLTRDEASRLTRLAIQSELPDWELVRKAMRGWGLI